MSVLDKFLDAIKLNDDYDDEFLDDDLLDEEEDFLDEEEELEEKPKRKSCGVYAAAFADNTLFRTLAFTDSPPKPWYPERSPALRWWGSHRPGWGNRRWK